MTFEFLAPALIFCALITASIIAILIHKRFPDHWRDDETTTTVRLTAGLFRVIAALVMGLMLNSAKNTYESVDRNLHAFGREIILLDRTLRQYGPEALETRSRLLAYARLAVQERPAGNPGMDRGLEQSLDAVRDSLNAIKPVDEQHLDVWRDIQQQFQKLVEMHWTLLEQGEGTIPHPLIVLLGAWLVAIFASFSFRAPPNIVVLGTLVTAAILVSAGIYLILDMDVPYSGPIHVSLQPLERAIAQLQH